MNLFRSFIAFLNKRFPEQLVVSKEEYKQLREELGAYNVIVQGVSQLQERIVMLEKQVQELNKSQGFVPLSKGAMRLER